RRECSCHARPRDRHVSAASFFRLSDLPLGRRLATRAEIHVVETVPGLHDGSAAARARFALVAAHLHVIANLRPELGRKARLHLAGTASDDVLQRTVEARHLFIGERYDPAFWVQLRLPEDLVRVRVPDPGKERLVLEKVAYLAARRAGTLGELRLAPREVAGLRSDLVEPVD